MSRARAQLSGVAAALVLLAGGTAWAQTREATPPPAPETGAVRAPEPVPAPAETKPEPRIRVHSSHTVDVIAPGEKVETILGKMRVERPPAQVEGGGARPPPAVRRPDKAHGPGRGGHPRSGEGGGRPPPSSPRTDGAPPPPPRTDGAPPPPPR
jgi:hypothetical protein